MYKNKNKNKNSVYAVNSFVTYMPGYSKVWNTISLKLKKKRGGGGSPITLWWGTDVPMLLSPTP